MAVLLARRSFPSWRGTESRWQELTTQLDDVNPDPTGTADYRGNTGHASVVSAWGSAVATNNSLIIGLSGGDQDYGGNEIYELDLSVDSPAWSRVVNPSTTVNADQSYYNDGRPNPGHAYDHQVFIPPGVINGNRLFQPARFALFSGITTSVDVVSWQRGSSDYDAQDTFTDKPGTTDFEAVAAYDASENLVWWKEPNSSFGEGIRTYDIQTDTWTLYSSTFVANWNLCTGAIDSSRRAFAIYNGTTLWAYDLDSPTDDPIVITTTGTGPSGNAPGLVYHPPSQAFIGWGGGATVYLLTPGANWRTDDWAWSTVTNVAGGATPTSAASNGTYGRFNYIPDIRSLIVVNSTTENTYVYPLPPGSL